MHTTACYETMTERMSDMGSAYSAATVVNESSKPTCWPKQAP